MRSREEILAELLKQAKAASAEERSELLKGINQMIEIRMQIANDKAVHAVGGLTARYREAYQALLEEDRRWLEGLERVKQALENSN